MKDQLREIFIHTLKRVDGATDEEAKVTFDEEQMMDELVSEIVLSMEEMGLTIVPTSSTEKSTDITQV